MKFLYLLIFLLAPCLLNGQSHILYQFNNETGLPSNLTKSITIDNDGLVWIATDGGLVRFDGKEFKNFDEKIFARFIKYVSPHPTLGLLIASDDGLGHAKPVNFSVEYNLLAASLHTYNDSLLYYPKTLFSAMDSTVWVSDISGVGRYKKGKFSKYNFEYPYHSNSFFRSFSFAELSGTIYITSWQGYLFYLDRVKDAFIEIPLPSGIGKKYVHSVYSSGDSLFLGMQDGLYMLRINESHQLINHKKLASVNSISAIGRDKSGDIYFGSYDEGLFRYHDNEITSMERYYPEFTGSSVKDLIIDPSQNIWVCTDDGVYLLKKKYFINPVYRLTGLHRAVPPKQLFSDNDDNIYYTDSDGIYLCSLGTDKLATRKVISFPGKSLLYSCFAGNAVFLISFSDKSLVWYDLSSGNILRRVELADDHFYSIYADSKGTAWSFLARTRAIVSIDKSGRRRTYPVDFEDVSFINKFYETQSGDILALANAHENFILRVNKNLGMTESVSGGIKLGYSSVNALDIAKYPDGFFVATDRGLMKFGKEFKFNGFFTRESGLLPKAVFFSKRGAVWLGTERGVWVYTKTDSLILDKNTGLQNSSISPGGVLQDKDGNVWVATDRGISALPAIKKNWIKSGKPVLLGVEYKKGDEDFHAELANEYPYGSSLNFIYCSPAYPAEPIRYRLRFAGDDTSWVYPKLSGIAILQDLKGGSYTVEISAKEPGKLWSDPVSYEFSIIQPWYLLPQSLVLFVLLFIVAVVVGTNLFISYRIRTLEKNRLFLQEKVEQRTRALQKAKKEVEKLLTETISSKSESEFVNNQLKKLLSIAAHDLKSPLQSILGLSNLLMEEPDATDVKEFGGRIYKSSVKMIQQIDELLSTAVFDAKKSQLHHDIFSISEILYEVVESNRPSANQKKQKIVLVPGDTPEIKTSRDWLTRILENLVNNAIKYSPHGTSVYITSAVVENAVLIKVEDEGPGFSEADFESMFVRFSRLSAKPTGGEISTGLGLSLVKEMIESLGGTVSAANRETGGAVFTLTLPLKNFLAPL